MDLCGFTRYPPHSMQRMNCEGASAASAAAREPAAYAGAEAGVYADRGEEGAGQSAIASAAAQHSSGGMFAVLRL